jgi:NitT/TauT family transport system substrate-binding protein
MASSPEDDVTPVLYAISSGLFRKAGLNVDLARVNSGAAASAAVAGGSIQIAQSGMISLLTAHARGLPFALIAPSGMYLSSIPDHLLLVKKDGPIRSARDLNGKTVGVLALRDLLTAADIAWIDQNGGDSSSVHFVEIPSSALLPALEEGRIDAATFVTPHLEDALASGQTRVLGKTFDAIGKRVQIAGWFSTQDWLEKNHDAAQRFARVLLDATRYANAHHAQTVDLIANFAGLDPKTIAGMARMYCSDYLDPRLITPLIDMAVRYKLLERPFDPQELISPYALRPPNGTQR